MTTLDTLDDQWAVLLTTFRRDGTPVGTPVSVAVDAGRGYLRSPGTAWKVKRLRNDPYVEVAPCTPRGRPTSQAMTAVARRLEGEEAHRVLRCGTAYYELRSADEDAKRSSAAARSPVADSIGE